VGGKVKMLLKGKRAIVTGGNAGIGKSVAIAYAKEGANVVVFGVDEAKNTAVVAELQKQGVCAAAVKCDVADPEQVAAAVEKSVGFLGGVDILANIAGISPKAPGGNKIPFYEIDIDTWHRVIEVNMSSVFYVSRLVSRYMMKQRYGKIINMSSIVGLTGSEHGPAAACYSASKAGVISLTRSMAYELAEYNITVNAAAPGRIATAMSSANNEYYNKRNMNDIPAKRFGTPEEVANFFVFYASDKSSYITGETTLIAGGWLIR
jgi:3-oxoacyl-[acyl-carrier protein] reductase